MRRTLLILFAVVAAGIFTSRAQSLDAFKDRLAAPTMSEAGWLAKVTVTEHGDVSRAVANASRNTSSMRINGYRVCIFSDNGQGGRDPRAGAMAAKSLFEQTYPGVKVDWFYEAPYFSVLAGNCLTVEEAIILKGRVAGTFPKAFVKSNENISISDILN